MPDFGDLTRRAAELGVRVAVVASVILAFTLVGRLTSPLLRLLLDRRDRPSYTRVFSGLYRVGVTILGSLFALTLAFPSVRVADVLAIFGIVSVAAGFAFKDTFENLLAGVLLILRDPFKSGDQVTIAGRDGTVEGVTVRETLLRGHNGRQYFIPNAKVMTEVIEVATARPALRQTFSLDFAPDTDFDKVKMVVAAALRSAPSVLAEPPPSIQLLEVADGEVQMACRFWAAPRRQDAAAARDAALGSVLAALAEHRVRLAPRELSVILAPRPAVERPGS